MKKSIKLLLALSFALPFAACAADDGDDDTGANTDVTNNTEPSTMTAPSTTVGNDSTGDETPADSGSGDETPADTGADTGTGEMACVHTCAEDADCLAMGGTDIGFVCTDTQCRLPACADDAQCVAQYSGWSFTPCTMGGGECAVGAQVCVDLGDGTGGCATLPSEFVMCATFLQAEVEATGLDDGMPVTVCGQDRAVCNDEDPAFCELPCAEDAHCAAGQACDTATGICGCADDSGCAAGWTCDADAGVCQCTADDQCNGGTCVDGACEIPGCASDAECMNSFNGGTVTCQ